jgi:hypothetical protein
MIDETRSDDEDDLLHALPGLARVYASAWWHTAEWTIDRSVSAGSRAIKAVAGDELPGDLLHDAREDMRAYARQLLGIVDAEGRVPSAVSDLVASRPRAEPDSSSEALRRRGEELLRASADVHYAEDAHPAYERILADLTPDEGRILRLLATGGPQPAIDVRTAKLPLGIGSEPVAAGLSMIGAEAGCRHTERVPAYLNNLFRLGLVWFVREPVADQLRYQVLEAQPEALAAIKRAGRARVVRRSVHLTPFGADFCEVCLPLDDAQ